MEKVEAITIWPILTETRTLIITSYNSHRWPTDSLTNGINPQPAGEEYASGTIK